MSYLITSIAILAVACYSIALHILDRKKSPLHGAGQIAVTAMGMVVYTLVFALLFVVMGADIEPLLMELTR